jgi:hypothetical protein
MIYPDLCHFLEVIVIRRFNIEDEHVLQRGEQRAQEVHVVKREMDPMPPA